MRSVRALLPFLIALWAVSLTVMVGWLAWRGYRGSFVAGPPAGPVISQTSSNETNSASPADFSEQLATLSSQVQQLQVKVNQMAGSNSSPMPAPQPTAASQPSREYYIPMGGGNTLNRTWTLLSGAEATFDPSNYQPIKSFYFQASGSIIGGEVHAVLVDTTHNRIYYEGMLVFNTNNPTWMTSPPLTVPPSASQMQVQILSTSGENAILNDSRLVIETGY